MSLSQNSTGSVLSLDHAMDCKGEPDRLDHDILKCKEKCCRLGHDIKCEENCCKRKKRIDRWETVLKSYEELTKPSSMAKPTVMADNHLTRAFKLTREIKELKKKNIEVKSELKALIKKSKQFTVDFLDACRDNEEVDVLLNFEHVKTLRDAVAVKHKEFIAHRHVQQVVYEKVQYEKCGARSFVSGLLIYAFYTLTFPILAFLFIFNWPKCVSEYMGTTFGKFVSHTSQFCTFVALLVFSSLGDTHEPSPTEYVIYAFILAMSLQQVRKIYNERSSYFNKWWNIVLIVMLVGFLLSGLLWLIGSTAIGGWSANKLASHWDLAGHQILLLANSLFSISSVVSVIYLGSLCQVNSVFGPLQLSTLRMFKDILKFLSIFLGVFFAFTLGVRSLYSYNRSLQVEYLNSNNITSYHMDDDLSTFADAWQVMFWALFDQTNVENFEKTHPRFKITSKTGKFLFAIYLITAVLVGINMLIAMMNNSFEYVAVDKDRLNWKMSRTAMWLEFADTDDYLLPPPYNVLHYPISYFRKKWEGRKVVSKKIGMNLEEDPEKIEMNPKKYQENIEMNHVDNDGDNKNVKRHAKITCMQRPDPDRKGILQGIADRYLKKKTEELEELIEDRKRILQEIAGSDLEKKTKELEKNGQKEFYESNLPEICMV